MSSFSNEAVKSTTSKLPFVSSFSIGNLTDLLRDLPLIRPIEMDIIELESDSIESDFNFEKLNLFDNRIQTERTRELLNSSDSNFGEIINKTLSQIDTSKINFKQTLQAPKQQFLFSPILKTTFQFNSNLFNGILNEQFLNFQQQQQNENVSSKLQNENINNKNKSIKQEKNQISIQNNESKQDNLDLNKLTKQCTNQTAAQSKDNLRVPTDSNPETIKANKFYSSEPNKQNIKNTTTNNSKKIDKPSQLSTWQADLKSQLSLPDDFTPELIQQLAMEGYDVTSALGSSSRKAKQLAKKQQQQQQNTNNANHKFNDDDSDSQSEGENDSNQFDDYNFNKISIKNQSKNNTFNENKNSTGNNNSFQKYMNKKNNCQLQKQQQQDVLSIDPVDHPSFKRFNNILDDLLETYEQDLQQMCSKMQNQLNDFDSDTIDEIPSEYLISRQTCADLVQEAFKLNSYSIMNIVKKESLFKLQNLLFFNIKDGIRSLHLINEDTMNVNNEQEKLFKEILIEKLLRASDCSIISLIIMTSSRISKDLIIEDIIEQIATFVKINLTETIFPHYDPIYKPCSLAESKQVNPTSKRKLLNQFQTNSSNLSSKTSNSSTSKHMNHFYNRMREILCLLSELIKQINLTDTIIITLTSLSVMCFFVENINDLQLETLKILTNLFSRYSTHRQLILDDILSSLIKLHSNKRNARCYKCFNGDSIQMFTALILQLIQSEVSILNDKNYAKTIDIEKTNESSDKNDNNVEISFEEKETFLLTTYDQSTDTAKKFLTAFFSKCKVKQADFDFRPIFENFIQDLLITVNKPEWPVSEIILNLLGIILINQIQNDQSDVQSRVNSLEYLGQIVSQLRKDSLEYQKSPEKIEKVLEKFKISSKKDQESIYGLQKGLVLYIDSLASNDQSLKFSKYYLISQWLKEVNQQNSDISSNLEYGEDRVEVHNLLEVNRKKIYSLIENMCQNESPSLDPSEAFIVSKYLSSLKKTLDKNFDYYLINILNLTGGGNDSSIPTQVRSKAIKCLSLIIEADPQILLKQKVFSCVESNFLHQTISVREASVDLVGRFITMMPELTIHYYKILSERILDVGVSVRKRVIKIFREICLNQPNFEYLTEICVKILRRINDEDAIKKLVIDTFFAIWFSPVSSKDLLLKRVLNIVDVVSEFNVTTNQTSMEIFESLFNLLLVNQSSSENSHDNDLKIIINENFNEKELLLNRSKEVEKSSKKIVDCLIENVLNTESNTNTTPIAYKRLVACFSTLYLFSKIKPDYFITHAEILLPYLNIKSTNANDTQIINSAAKILECVVPLLQSPSNSFLITLEESLCKLIFQGGMVIVSSCISCLGTVVNKLTRNYKLAADCLFKFYNNASYLRKTINPKKLEANSKPILYRVLFTLGLLSKHFDVESEEFKEFKICAKEDLFNLFLYFINNFEHDVQQKALIGLGSFLTRNSEFMIKDEIKTLYLKYIKSDQNQVPFNLKVQVFANLTDYLQEEDQRNLAKSAELLKVHLKDDLKEMLDVQSGMASTIIQSYLKPILESYLTSNITLRIGVFNCLSMILNQGLVYPIECVPYLIAMTTDNEKKIQTKALAHLTNLQKAHPNFVQSKSIAGTNISFLLQNILKTNLDKTTDVNNSNSLQNTVTRGYSETNEILSLNHHLYSLLRSNKSYRRAFIQQLLKMFDDSSVNHIHTTLRFMLFITDNLAYFPYQLLDEPLYLIHQIDLIISVTGINLLQTFKEHLLNNNKTNEKHAFEEQAENNRQYSDIDFISCMECPDEADDDFNSKQLIKSDGNNYSSKFNKNLISNTKNLVDDDDDETCENVYNNLPSDLKPLKECMYKAQGCCLLLILKQFLKEVYSINDNKIQNYSPTDSAKINDRPLTSRKTNRKFNPKQIIDYILNYEKEKLDDESIKQTLVKEYLEFKELILSIDQVETNKIDENKPNTKTNQNEAKLAFLQQKLFEGIEKIKSVTNTPGGQTSGQDSNQATPKNKMKNKSNRSLSSSAKKSNKKRKRKKDSDESSDDSDYIHSDLEDESFVS